MRKIKLKKRVIVAIILIIICLIVFLWYYIVNTSNSVNEVRVLKEIEDYDYKLEDNETALYNDLFDELKRLLNRDEINQEEYAKLVAQLFVADFYNLKNKINRNDIGGVQFIHEDIQDNVVLNAKNTFYKYLENNLYGDRKQELPSVKEITVESIETITYEYNDKQDSNAYQVILNWKYNKDFGYQTDAVITIVHEGNKLSIVELKEPTAN